MKQVKWIAILLCFVMIGCAHTADFNSDQKYYMARGIFNDAVEQYKDWALTQPEDVRAKLRVHTKDIKSAEKALDIWGESRDDEDKMQAYLDLKDLLFPIFVAYGIEIKEAP